MLPLVKFNHFVDQKRLFTQQSKILAAVSGGMDSVLMLHLLHAAGYQLAIAHCNFQLRDEEATRDENFCRQLALDLGIPFFTTRFDTTGYAAEHQLSIQMAARDLRYTWFEQIRQQQGYDVVALAHHQNDTIETILLNLTRGTGIAGLHGIQPKNGTLIRPMLCFTRDEVALSIKANHISYVEDSSNAAVKYARNKIRHEVVPRLKDLNPNLEQTFQDHLQHFNELEELLEMELSKIRETLFTHHKNEIHIPIVALTQIKPLHLLLFGLLKPYGFNATSVTDLISALGKHAGRRFEAPDWRLVVDRDQLILSPISKQEFPLIELDAQTGSVIFGSYQISITNTTPPYPIVTNRNLAAVDNSLLTYPLTVRPWQLGDYFYPLGMETRKKLSDFFIGQKIPVSHKNKIPVVVNGNGEIIWIAGYRVDNRYKITPETKKISIFELTEL